MPEQIQIRYIAYKVESLPKHIVNINVLSTILTVLSLRVDNSCDLTSFLQAQCKIKLNPLISNV